MERRADDDFNEETTLQPDRLPEASGQGKSHGFDHNYEYKIYGTFTGDRVYDPNSNKILPSSRLRNTS